MRLCCTPRLAQLLAFFQERDGDDAKIPDGLWEREDADDDGVISWEEFGGSKGLPMMTPLERELHAMQRIVEDVQAMRANEAWQKLGSASNDGKAEEQMTKDEP